MSEIDELFDGKIEGQNFTQILIELQRNNGEQIVSLKRIERLLNSKLFGRIFIDNAGFRYRFAGIKEVTPVSFIGNFADIIPRWEVYFLDSQDNLLLAIDDKEHDIELVLAEE